MPVEVSPVLPGTPVSPGSLRSPGPSRRQVLTGGATGALAVLLPEGAAASLAPDPSLAAALRLRASELAPFAQPGGTGGIGYD